MRHLPALLVIAAVATLPACTTTIEGGGSGSGGGTTGSTSTTGTGGPAFSCTAPTKPLAPAITVFDFADAEGHWSDPQSGLAGDIFLEPATAGSFHGTNASGTEFTYTQIQQQFGQLDSGDASFGVWFSSCVDASSYTGITFSVWPLSVPAGARVVFQVQTASTTPPPHGSCSAGCAPPTFTGDYSQFGSQMPYTAPWSQFSGAVQTNEIVGLRWTIDAWEGPPPMNQTVDIMAQTLAFE